MIKQMLERQLAHFLSQYGTDPQGNYVISPASIEEVAQQVAQIAGDSLERPVVTFSITDVLSLADAAGFTLEQHMVGGVRTSRIMDKCGVTPHDAEVQKLVDHTTQLILERVAAQRE